MISACPRCKCTQVSRQRSSYRPICDEYPVHEHVLRLRVLHGRDRVLRRHDYRLPVDVEARVETIP